MEQGEKGEERNRGREGERRGEVAHWQSNGGNFCVSSHAFQRRISSERTGWALPGSVAPRTGTQS